MIIEYIGYAIDSSRNDKLDEAYRRAGALLDASPHCQVTAKARQLASRARRRVQGAPVPDVDLDRQREVADACLAAARHGDFDGLLAVLDRMWCYGPTVRPARVRSVVRRPWRNAHSCSLTLLRLRDRRS